ncbi:MAG TPA: sodium-translocating pyrophosphatase [Oscillospiraceae bacterium]|nr:sodium-translocating pyrophosphatase [Oscillospiraceae bacterium]HNW04406.1 sodium-translocating pyrophosphatase [Oscillospiraceae bacterium]
MGNLFYAVPFAAVLALVVAFAFKAWIGKQEEGTDRMKEIAGYIREGAMAFLRREYKTIVIFGAAMVLLLGFVISWYAAGAFVIGAAFSVLAGYIGMRTATLANVRTANQARVKGMAPALKIAFRGGAVMGLCVVGLGLLGVSALFCLFNATIGVTEGNAALISEVVTGYSLGASSMALFGRVGGGIYTKAADVGADLVGKVEAGIPEDDPRNPAVIADNVGDNVGDVAGMGSDLFESYVGSIVSAITLAVTIPSVSSFFFGNVELPPIEGSLFPLLLAAIGICASVIAAFMVGGKEGKNPAKQLNLGTYISSGIVIVASFFLSRYMFEGLGAFVAVVVGLVIGVAIGALTEVYTSADYKTVKEIAHQSETGAATVIISGFASGLNSTVFPILLIAVGIILSYLSFGLYGIAIAAVGMLSTTGTVVAVDAYGPISDNAGGIAEMSDLPENVRDITDTLDSVGNTTAAVGKGFAIGSAALTALALFVSYSTVAGLTTIDLLDPMVVAGLFIGGMLPMLFGAITMNSVGKAAYQMIEEVRRQFHADAGILAGTSKPDYAKCVDISTRSAIKEMLFPGILAIASPIACGLILGPEALGGLLGGALVTGVLLAITMSNAGGAWDNAKKYIENGNFGGKGSECHKAAIVGDTVGDPFKDTSGPSMNILIKLMTIVALVFVPLFL